VAEVTNVRAGAVCAFLDEAGSVYVPVLRPERGMVKLNEPASRIWRALLSDGLAAEEWAKPAVRELVLDLHRAGAITMPVREEG
jgi:hypothetical protein